MINKERADTPNYKGWLISDSFWKRAWAVYCYALAVHALVITILILLFMVAMIISSIL